MNVRELFMWSVFLNVVACAIDGSWETIEFMCSWLAIVATVVFIIDLWNGH